MCTVLTLQTAVTRITDLSAMVLRGALIAATCAVLLHPLSHSIVGSPSRDNLVGKRVVVTGGSKGIGFEIAKQYVLAGADVVISSRTEATRNKAVVDIQLAGMYQACADKVKMTMYVSIYFAMDTHRLVSTRTHAYTYTNIHTHLRTYASTRKECWKQWNDRGDRTRLITV